MAFICEHIWVQLAAGRLCSEREFHVCFKTEVHLENLWSDNPSGNSAWSGHSNYLFPFLLALVFAWHTFSKAQVTSKQNQMQEKTPFYGSVFLALSGGVLLSGSNGSKRE